MRALSGAGFYPVTCAVVLLMLPVEAVGTCDADDISCENGGTVTGTTGDCGCSCAPGYGGARCEFVTCAKGAFLDADQQTCSACGDHEYQNEGGHREAFCKAQSTCDEGQFISADSKTAVRACSPCGDDTYQSFGNQGVGQYLVIDRLRDVDQPYCPTCNPKILNLAEVQAFDSVGNLLQPVGANLSSAPAQPSSAGNCIDGSFSSECHSHSGDGAVWGDLDPRLRIDYGSTVNISKIVVVNRRLWASGGVWLYS